jgi:hypothetical protein
VNRRVVAVILPGVASEILAVGKRVQVAGEEGEFMVIRVDRERRSADLMKMTGIRRVEEGVPLTALRVVKDDAGRLHTGPETPKPK